MRIPQTYIQKGKATLHGVQLLFIFLAAVLTLAIMVKDGGSDGRVGYALALCFLTLPALVYQVMVPMWSRAWRFANAYAYAALDLAYAILWLAAFAALANWTSDGISKGEKGQKNADDKGKDKNNSDKHSGCAAFGFGSETRCKIASADVAMGVIICLLFVATSVISIQGILKYRKTGSMPGQERDEGIGKYQRPKYEDPNKEAWNVDTTEFEDESAQYDTYGKNSADNNGENERVKYGQTSDEEDHVGLLNGARPLDLDGRHDSDPEQHSARPYGAGSVHNSVGLRSSHFDPQSPDGRVQFPTGNYR
ncbi:hypothetical protein K431DRAFT_347042 [Polychaeton citri CBS 116435]|uniref:MARVEL domain-containing protein n=1 Tax=Polychaeton citri CBS 116435 TaxID=1314669 RepID=A0A9P4Q779_9PEZI|nr:hypothetical protein K431DRAFT_347042 [Polychaeton citri CBS 116435]